jgi:PAS domain S-box-containing protein
MAKTFNTSLIPKKHGGPPASLMAIFIIVSAGILAAGFFYYKNNEKSYRTESEHLLKSIAELKVSEIVSWRKERLADARVLHKNSAFTQLVRRAIVRPVEPAAQKRLRVWLGQLKVAYSYRDVILIDAAGRVRQSAGFESLHICDEIQKHLPEIRRNGQIVFLDFHREDSNHPVSLSILIPVTDNGLYLGAVALVIDPDTYLYPMISRWPTPAATGETLLVRREGGEVVFLNELKFQKDTALTLRFPLHQNDLPGARAARGEERVMEGIDYRGVPVVAALRAVPDSPWFMVARMDREEIYAPIRKYFLLLIFMMCALIFAAAAAGWVLWQRQRNVVYRRELEAALALQASDEKFRKAFMTSPDAILITRWRDGRVVSANEGFLAITGYTREEVEGSEVAKLFIWNTPDDRQRIIDKVKADGFIENLEAGFLNKSGQYYYGLVSASVLKIDGESHLLSITRDITERKTSEEALQKAHECLRRFHDANIVGIVTATAEGDILEANDYYLDLIGFSREEFESGKIDWRALTPSEWLGADDRAIAEVRREGTCAPYEKQYLRRDKTLVDVFVVVAKLPGQEQQLAAFALDITDRKRVEREVSRLNEELERRVVQRTAELSAKNEELVRLNRVFVDREIRMRELKEKIARMEKGAS